MENLIAALEAWKEDQVRRLPPIKLICPQCGGGFSVEFQLPESCPSCQALLLQPRSTGSRVFAIIAIAALALVIPTAIYFFLGAISDDPGMGKLARLLVENRTVFFFVSLAIILPVARAAFLGVMHLFGDLFGHAVGKETEKDLMSTFSQRLARARGATDEMKYWTFCRLVLIKGAPYRVITKPSGKAATNLIELARDLEVVGIVLYLLSGGRLGNPASAISTGRGPYPGWIRSIMHDSPPLTEAAKAMRAAANDAERKWLTWFGENFAFGSFMAESSHQYKGAPEFAKEIKPYDYYRLIARAVESLPENTAEARNEVYERARSALMSQLRGRGETEIARERSGLEEAIRNAELKINEKDGARLSMSRPALITAHPITLRAEPQSSAPVIKQMPVGDCIFLGSVMTAGDSQWVEARTGEGAYGYIEGTNKVKLLKPYRIVRGRVPVFDNIQTSTSSGRHLEPSDNFFPVVSTKEGDKAWTKILDQAGRIGFISADVRVKPS